MGSGIPLRDTAALVFRTIVISNVAIVTRPGMPECSNKEGIGRKHPPSALLQVMRKLSTMSTTTGFLTQRSLILVAQECACSL